jgi:serpin B
MSTPKQLPIKQFIIAQLLGLVLLGDTSASGNPQAVFQTISQGSTTPNIIFSPTTLITAMRITQAGAVGDTKTIIAYFLEGSPEDACTTTNTNTTTTTANAIVPSHGFEPNPRFIKTCSLDFGATLLPPNLDQVNAWVSEKTKGGITHFLGELPKGGITILSTCHFKDQWAIPFKEASGLFYSEANTGKNMTPPQVPMLSAKSQCRILSGTTGEIGNIPWKACDIPYKNGESLVVILPQPREDGTTPSLDEFLATLTSDRLKPILHDIQTTSPQSVDVTIPKVHIRSRESLKHVMMALGMRLPFTPGADFSGMLNPNATDKSPLFINDIIQESGVDVDKTGTEASSATAVIMVRTMAMLPKEDPAFKADRPFVFIIRHGDTPLFEGVVRDPKTPSN